MSLAALLSTYIQIDTQQPPGPQSWPVDETGQYVHARWIVETWVEPLGLPHQVLDGGTLIVPVDTPDTRPPVILASHADVVAVDEADLGRWTHHPLSGAIADGYVWGRGALDNKASTVVTFEALRELMEGGGMPSRDLIILVTPDEEVAGELGAKLVSERMLPELGSPTVVIDEGSLVLPDFYEPLVVAAVAVAEKTYVTVELTVRGEGGHSSMPTRDAPTMVLSRALARVADWETEDGLTEQMAETLRRISEREELPTSLALGYPEVFEPVLLSIVQATPAGNAVTRDTVAITMLDAGVKDNVVPNEARATLNARLMPGKDVEVFLGELAAVIDDDRVELTPAAWPAVAEPGSWETETFAALEAVIPRHWPGAVVAPIVTPGTTDSRFFGAAGLETYRFLPFELDAGERKKIHGIDERITLENLERAQDFWLDLLQAL